MADETLRVQDGGEVTGRIPVPVAARTLSLALSQREKGQNGEIKGTKNFLSPLRPFRKLKASQAQGPPGEG